MAYVEAIKTEVESEWGRNELANENKTSLVKIIYLLQVTKIITNAAKSWKLEGAHFKL